MLVRKAFDLHDSITRLVYTMLSFGGTSLHHSCKHRREALRYFQKERLEQGGRTQSDVIGKAALDRTSVSSTLSFLLILSGTLQYVVALLLGHCICMYIGSHNLAFYVFSMASRRITNQLHFGTNRDMVQ